MSDSQFPPQSWGGIDDVIIVGGGLSGLFCALKLAPRPVTVITGAPVGQGATSTRMQGGVAAALGPGDRIEDHVVATVAAGAGLVDAAVALSMAREGADRVHDLLNYGVPFERDLDGSLKLSRETAHSQRRILRVGGDMAGKAIMQSLVAAVRRTPSIRVLESYVAEQLRTEGPYVTGLVARDLRGGLSDRLLFSTRAVVLASGGVGHLYQVTSNPAEARGEGLAMAARAGALIADAEFVQFHPTAVDLGCDPAPLAPEVLRSEGASIVDRAGKTIMFEVHTEGEFAPRHVVARAVHDAIISGRGAFLDCTRGIPDRAERFPVVHAACMAAGIDPAVQPIPIVPAAHYHIGGVHVDGCGRTTLDGLWACGEVACTGAHGANRLAANSLLEAVVFASRIAEDIQGQLPNHKVVPWTGGHEPGPSAAPGETDEVERRLRQTMSRHVGPVRDAAGLGAALDTIESLARRRNAPQMRNALVAARIIAAAALRREESRGVHFRSDFPAADPDQARRKFTTLAETEAGLRPVPASMPATSG